MKVREEAQKEIGEKMAFLVNLTVLIVGPKNFEKRLATKG